MEDRYRVRMEGIKKSFGGVKALSGVSLAVRHGEFMRWWAKTEPESPR